MSGLAAALAWAFVLAPIDWHAPSQCPDAAEVERRARALGPEVAPLDVAGHVSQGQDGTFVLELAIGDAPPRRYLARDCDALADVAALVLAVARDPVAVATKVAAPTPPPAIVPAPAPPSMVPATSEPARPRPSPPPDVPAARRRPPVEGFARVHGVFGIGELPRFDAGVGVAFGIGAGLGRFELHAVHLFSRTAELPGLGGAAAAIASWNLSPRGCAVLGRRTVRAVLCAGPELGIVTAEGRGLRIRDQAVALWISALAAPGLEWALRPWLRLHAGVELFVALRRPQFAAVERPDDLVTLGAGGLRAMVGFAGHFGPGSRSSRAR